jgi:hypothetical protein
MTLAGLRADRCSREGAQIVEAILPPATEDRIVSYLPLSHIAAQLIDIHVPLYLGAQPARPPLTRCTVLTARRPATASRGSKVSVWFARPDALKGSLGVTLGAVQVCAARVPAASLTWPARSPPSSSACRACGRSSAKR